MTLLHVQDLSVTLETAHGPQKVISHDLGVIAQTTQNVMVMYTGSIVEMGTTIDVFQNMLYPYTQGLSSAIPHVGSSAASGKNG